MIYRNHKMSVSFVAAVVLTASAASANEPEWQEVSNNPEVVVEVDAANIRVREHKLTAWVRLTTPRDMGTEGIKFRSAVSLTVFDCDAEKSGVSSTTAFAGPRGEGKIVHTEEGFPVPIAEQSYERPGTTGYKVLKFVCERAERTRTADAEAAKLRMAEADQPKRSQEETETVRYPRQAGTPARLRSAADPNQFYPPGAKRREEQGSPVVQACVGSTGRLVREPVVTETSGFPEIDAAAIKVAKANRYLPGTDDGQPLAESCVKFKVKFAVNKY